MRKSNWENTDEKIHHDTELEYLLEVLKAKLMAAFLSMSLVTHTLLSSVQSVIQKKKDHVLKYNLWLSVFRYIQLVRRLLCEHGWLSIGCQPDGVTVCWVNCPITAEGCLWERLELGLQHSSHPALKPQRLLLRLTDTRQSLFLTSTQRTLILVVKCEMHENWSAIMWKPLSLKSATANLLTECLLDCWGLVPRSYFIRKKRRI